MLSQKHHKGEGKAQDGVALVGGRHVLSISLVNVSATTSNGVPMKKGEQHRSAHTQQCSDHFSLPHLRLDIK